LWSWLFPIHSTLRRFLYLLGKCLWNMVGGWWGYYCNMQTVTNINAFTIRQTNSNNIQERTCHKSNIDFRMFDLYTKRTSIYLSVTIYDIKFETSANKNKKQKNTSSFKRSQIKQMFFFLYFLYFTHIYSYIYWQASIIWHWNKIDINFKFNKKKKVQ